MKIGNSRREGSEDEAHKEECAFLKTFVEFVKADLATLGIPKIALQDGMHSMHQDGHQEFAVEFATQSTLAGGVSLMDPQDGLELLE